MKSLSFENDLFLVIFSVGGLGKEKSVACVSNVIVENVWLQNTLAGSRIKTWQVPKINYYNFLKIKTINYFC